MQYLLPPAEMFPFDLDLLDFSNSSNDHLLPHPDRCLRPESDFFEEFGDETSEVDSVNFSQNSM